MPLISTTKGACVVGIWPPIEVGLLTDLGRILFFLKSWPFSTMFEKAFMKLISLRRSRSALKACFGTYRFLPRTDVRFAGANEDPNS